MCDPLDLSVWGQTSLTVLCVSVMHKRMLKVEGNTYKNSWLNGIFFFVFGGSLKPHKYGP